MLVIPHLKRLAEYLGRASGREVGVLETARAAADLAPSLDRWRKQRAADAVLIVSLFRECILPAELHHELTNSMEAHGFAAALCGCASEKPDSGDRAVFAIHDPRIVRPARTNAKERPLAILATYNDADCIEEIVTNWLLNGCDVYAIDNWSTDATHALLERLADENGDRIKVERFPSAPSAYFRWKEILARKEEIAAAQSRRWIFHSDSDEIRISPWPGVSLSHALDVVEAYGANRVDFTLLNFRPTPGHEFRGRLSDLPYFEYGNRPGHFVQKKAWLQPPERVNLRDSGGHRADFADARDFPYKFILKHYPIRSREHGKRKIFQERRPRWDPEERAKGDHVQYDHIDSETVLLWNAPLLHRFTERTLFEELPMLISDLSKP